MCLNWAEHSKLIRSLYIMIWELLGGLKEIKNLVYKSLENCKEITVS